MENLDREVKDYDIDEFVQNSPPEVTTELAEWMDTELYNVLSLKTKDNPLQTVTNVAVCQVQSHEARRFFPTSIGSLEGVQEKN